MPDLYQQGIEFSSKGQPVKMRLGTRQFGTTTRDPVSGKQTWWCPDLAFWETIRTKYFEQVSIGMVNFPVPVTRLVPAVSEVPAQVPVTVAETAQLPPVIIISTPPEEEAASVPTTEPLTGDAELHGEGPTTTEELAAPPESAPLEQFMASMPVVPPPVDPSIADVWQEPTPETAYTVGGDPADITITAPPPDLRASVLTLLAEKSCDVGSLATALGKSKDELRPLLEANGFKVSPGRGWVTDKAA